LFESESISPTHGIFLDQRFVDYLSAQADALDRMNWRKFEGLAAEFFARCGLKVKLGKGRNDDGVDLRVWVPGTVQDATVRPTLLVQCKRQKQKVGKVILKALWADVQHAGAKSGLVVTTSCLSPGAVKTCAARGYHVDQADRLTLRAWLKALRTPFSGLPS